MWVSIIGLIVSVIAIFVSVLTYFFNTKNKERENFQIFVKQFYNDINALLKHGSIRSMLSFRYDYVNNFFHDFYIGKYTIRLKDSYNENMKKLVERNESFDLIYKSVFTNIQSLNKNENKEHIKYLNSLVENYTISLNSYYMNIINLYDNTILYFNNVIKRKDFFNIVEELYESVLNTSIYCEILNIYISSMRDLTNKMLLDFKYFKNIQKSKFKDLYIEIEKRINDFGICDYIESNNKSKLNDYFLELVNSREQLVKNEKDNFIKNLEYIHKIQRRN